MQFSSFTSRNRERDRFREGGRGANWKESDFTNFGWRRRKVISLTVPGSQTYSFFGSGAGRASVPGLAA